MTEAQYLQLCKSCDRALMSSDSTMERVSIPWLHIIREHPVFLQNYTDVFNNIWWLRAIKQKCARFLYNRAWWLWQLGKAVRATGMPWSGSSELPERIDFLFVSHLLNASQAGQENDFYFGEVPAKLVEQGYAVVVALINHSCCSDRVLAEEWKDSTAPRVVFSETLSVREELAIHNQLKIESSRLRVSAKNGASILDSRVFSRASQESLSSGSHRSLRVAKQVAVLVTAMKPKALIVTFEGHAWERVVFCAARSVSPTIRCVGYQHSALFRLQHAIRRNLSPKYNPDCILTAGSLGKSRLEQAPDMEHIPIVVGGSGRGSKAVANGQIINRFSGGHETPSMLTCLVLPEGIVSECNLLFEFSLACACRFPDVRFVWRLHPSVDFGSLINRNKKFRNIPDNILLSTESLEFDIERSSWVLYRGTTAIIQAMGAGVKPLYLRVKGEMSIDPLYDLDVWRTAVESIDDFINIVDMDRSNPANGDKPASEKIENYCADFFAPFNIEAFKDTTVNAAERIDSP